MNYPDTPAAIAQAALDGINTHREAFHMRFWYTPDSALPGGGGTAVGSLTPDEAPPCGTVLCAAGWIAHVTGWTLVRTDKLVELTDPYAGGYQRVHVFAEKDGVRAHVETVADRLLGVLSNVAPWYDSEEEALDFLRAVASGHWSQGDPHAALTSG